MSTRDDLDFAPPDDGYEAYYTGKLWEWVPEIYRTLDAASPSEGVLRAIIEIVAAEAAVIRRDIDRIWEDQSVELADEWALAYLGRLVGATRVSEFNTRGQRLSVANAVRYQRRKGTLTVLQELIRDIGGIEGIVVEAFKRLVRFPHRLDIDAIKTGRITGTPAGGLIDLKNPRVAGLHNGAFDEAAHFHDVRKLRGPFGRYGIPKANFHLYPFRSYFVNLPTPLRIGPAALGRWALDPSGREVPVFQRGQASNRPADDIREIDLPDTMLCRRFNAATHVITIDSLETLGNPAVSTALSPLINIPYPTAASFLDAIEARLSAANFNTFADELLELTRIPSSFKASLWNDSVAFVVGDESNDPVLAASDVTAADLSEWGTTTSFRDWTAIAFDPSTGRLVQGPGFTDIPAPRRIFTRLHYGLFYDIGAGTYSRASTLSADIDAEFPAGTIGGGGGFTSPGPQSINLPTSGVHRLSTSKTYRPQVPATRRYPVVGDLVLEADDGVRPYVVFRLPAATLDITFLAPTPPDPPARLTIDGLWIGLIAASAMTQIVADADTPATPVTARIILDGVFEEVVLRHVTIDPGGERTRVNDTTAVPIPHVRTEIEGMVEMLRLERCICGPVWETNANLDICNVGDIEICDSIVQSIDTADPAIRTRLGKVSLERTTVLGDVEVNRLYASNSLIDGRVVVTDNQHGCFRYSATGDYADPGPAARLPAQFESYLFSGDVPEHVTLSKRFGDPRYGALSPTAPNQLQTGAENGSEMGAYNLRGLSVLLNDLEAKVREFLPVGVQPQYILENRSTN